MNSPNCNGTFGATSPWVAPAGKGKATRDLARERRPAVRVASKFVWKISIQLPLLTSGSYLSSILPLLSLLHCILTAQ